MMTFSVAFPVMLGATALAVDSASFYDQQSRMQTAADASALAVAKELHVYRKNLDELKAVGKARVETLLAEAGIAERPHTSDVTINAKDNLISVSISMVAETLLPVDVWGENPISVSSQAHAYGQSRLCVLGLDPSQSDTIKADSSAALNAPQCAVQSNSKDPSGLNVGSGSSLVSTVICTSGGTTGGGSFTPSPETDCPRLDDPLAARQPPTVAGCDYRDRLIANGNVSISPGVYCGGLKIEGNAQVTAEPGVYIITEGYFRVSDNAVLKGDYVSFYFHDDAATMEFKPGTTIDLSAPKDGPMAGILFYENRAASLVRSFVIRSKNAHRLLGTIYLPRGKLIVDVKGKVADLSAYTVIVAKQLEVLGANLVINSDYGGTDVPVPDGVGPNSRMVMLNR
jgi:hypothetical protein